MTTPNTNTVDVLDDLAGDAETSTETENTESPTETGATEATDASATDEATETDETFLSEIPEPKENFVSITEFAGHMTQQLMLRAFQANDMSDPSRHYVQAQSVYQTVKAQKDQIPHIKVKALGEDQARVYVDKAEATPWWFARTERLATRGTGATARASSRTPADNLTLLEDAAYRNTHAKARADLWAARVDQTAGLIDKYKGFLNDQDVSDEDIAKTVQTGIDTYNADVAEKAKNRKGSKTNESTDTE